MSKLLREWYTNLDAAWHIGDACVIGGKRALNGVGECLRGKGSEDLAGRVQVSNQGIFIQSNTNI